MTVRISRLAKSALIVLLGLMSGPAHGADDRPVRSSSANEIAGHWLGTLRIQTIKLRLAVTIREEANGSLKGTLNSLDQDGLPHPLDQVSAQESKVRFRLNRSRLTYDGTLNAERNEITGQLKQAGATMPLDFKKVDKLPEGRKRPQEPKRPFPYKEEPVTYENKSAPAKFAGTLTLPRSAGSGAGRFPAVFLITGSGQQDRDETVFGHRPFLVLADFLARRGIAVLRADDRGVGGSTGEVLKATTEDFASDVMAAVAYLKTRPEIDPHRIGLIGHSEGGIIAPMVAVRLPDVAFIVLLAGTGIPGREISLMQTVAIAKQSGFSDSLTAKAQSLQEKLFAAATHDSDPALLRSRIKQAVDDYRNLLTAAEKKRPELSANVDASVKAVSSPWFRYYLTYDPRPTLRKVRCPVLALIGERDFQVPAKANAPEIEKALQAGGNKDFTVKVLPGLNHLFQSCKTGNLDEYAAIDETIAPSALELIADWVRRHTT